MANSSNRTSVCGYCGATSTLTKDHVVPRSLFGSSVPSNIPSISACRQCNNHLKSADDNYLRDLFASDLRHAQHPVARANFAKVRRSARNAHSTFAKATIQAQRVNLFTPGGIYVGQAFTVPVDQKRLERIMKTMARGLFFHHTRTILPDDPTQVAYSVRFWDDPTSVMDVVTNLLQAGAPHVEVGDGSVVEYLYAIAPGDPKLSIWLLNFYRRSIWSITTYDPSTPLQPVQPGVADSPR
jgi:hypothetical protein